MMSRRIAPRAFAAAAATAAPAMTAQKRHDHDRWYGHALELDIWNYKYTGETPKWMRPQVRSQEDTEDAKLVLPTLDFASTYECLLYDADRLNVKLGRKEFGNEIKARLEKQANTVARAQHLVKAGTYAEDPALEDTMIARIADEEHVQAEMKYVKCIRANEMAEDNRLDILPGGSPNSLREKTRWNTQMELHPLDRSEIMTRLMAWLPEKYHIVYFDDFQTVAANDAALRKELLKVVENVEKEHAAEAKAAGYGDDLKEVVAELADDVDPTRHITLEAIAKCASVDQLEEWSHAVHEYNGDERILAIYAKGADLTNNEAQKALVKNMREWSSNVKNYA